jgi:hypothetical protein
MQMSFPWHSPTDRPRRRALWRAEMRRLMQVVDDQRTRDRRDHDEALTRLSAALADTRMRLRDVERTTGCADIATAPRTRPQLRAFAGNGA